MTIFGVGSTSSLEDILLSSDRSVQSQPKLVRKLSLRAVHFLSHASKIPLDCLWFYHEKPRRVMWGIPWSGCVVENSTASGISAASVSEGIVSSLHFFLCCPPPPRCVLLLYLFHRFWGGAEDSIPNSFQSCWEELPHWGPPWWGGKQARRAERWSPRRLKLSFLISFSILGGVNAFSLPVILYRVWSFSELGFREQNKIALHQFLDLWLYPSWCHVQKGYLDFDDGCCSQGASLETGFQTLFLFHLVNINLQWDSVETRIPKSWCELGGVMRNPVDVHGQPGQ